MVNTHSRRSNTARSRRPRQSPPPPPGISIRARGTTTHHSIEAFSEPDFASNLLQELQRGNKVGVVLVDLLEWNEAARFPALQFLAELEPATIRTERQGPAHPTLLDAILAEMVGDADIARCELGRRAALEVIALCHADAIEFACSKVCHRLKELGVKGVLPQSLAKIARQMALSMSGAAAATPQGLAERFLAATNMAIQIAEGSALLYYRQTFFAWNGTIFHALDDDVMESRVTAWLQGVRPEPDAPPINSSLVRDIVMNLRGMVSLDSNQRELPLWIERLRPPSVQASNDIAFLNGRIDRGLLLSEAPLPELEIGRPDCRYFSTVVLPFEFDAQADCPLWVQTLAEIFAQRADDDHRIEVIQEFVGWTLVPGDMRFQKFLALQGRGNNGKSLLIKIWKQLLGPANVSHVPLDQLNGEFRLVEMMNKLANIAADMNYIDKVAEGVLKALTSGDPISVNRKNKPPITMIPTAKLIFGTNELPRFNDRSEGIWRRLLTIPFHRAFRLGVDEDLTRAERLQPELAGIFNWAVEGARRLYEQGGFTPCGECERAKRSHRVHSDPFLQWWELRAAADPHVRVQCEDAYRSYQKFCENNGNKFKNSAEFGKELMPRLRPCSGATKRRFGHRSTRTYFYCGIRLIGGADQNVALPESDCRCSEMSNRCPSSRRAPGHT